MSKLVKLGQSSTKTFVDNLNNNFDLMHPVGSVMCMSKKTELTELANIYGGKWNGIDRGFSSLVKNDNGRADGYFILEYTKDFAEYIGCNIVRTSNTVRLRLKLKLKFTPLDALENPGYFNLGKIGISNIPYGVYGLAYCDDAEGTILYSVGTDGKLTIIDSYYKTGATLSTPQTWSFDITFNVDANNMRDDACDKFYYKRVE